MSVPATMHMTFIDIEKKMQQFRDTCPLLPDSIFNTAITYARVGGKPHIRKGYRGEADYFAVYSPDTGKVYLIPVDDVPGTEARLRLNPSKNNQQKGVRWAKDYKI